MFQINGPLFTNADEITPNPEFTVGGKTGMYRVLSAYEWQYLLGIGRDYEIRANAESLRNFGVEVCGKANCLIIAPDVCLNGYEFDNTKTSYDAGEG